MQRSTRLFAVAVIVATSVSCGSRVGTGGGRGSSFLVIDALQGVRGGAGVGTASAILTSDVVTNVTSPAPCSAATPCPTFFGDGGQVTMHVVMKDAGAVNATTPTPINNITLARYRVEYTRADGRNRPGVDVPFAFDGVITNTVTPDGTTVGFSLVRVQAKSEMPLMLLQNQFSPIITELATVTFYGQDQAGNQVSVSGSIQIDFGNFGDQ